jgi:hypothetical protein
VVTGTPARCWRGEIRHALFPAGVCSGVGLTLLVRLRTAGEETARCAGQVLHVAAVCTVTAIEFHSIGG